MAGFTNLTLEQRREFGRKGAATRKANLDKRKQARELAAPIEEPDVSEPVKLPSPPDADVYEGLLTDAEKAELLAAARKRAREDSKKALKAAYAKEMLEQARREIGEMPPDEEQKKFLEEKVRIYVDLPRMRKPTGGDHDPDPIILDQTMYVSGRYYEVSRAKAIYLLCLMDQVRRHVNQVDGRSRTYYHPQAGQMIYQGGPALGGGSVGSSFDAIHKRPG